MKFLQERIGDEILKPDDKDPKKWLINQPNSKNDSTLIQLQSDKQKLFL